MNKTFYIIPTFLLFTIQIYGQAYKMIFSSSVKLDKQLKEVWEFKIEGNDSSLSSNEFYSDGLIRSSQRFFKDTLRTEIFFKYDENNLLSLVSEYSKDANKNVTKKSIARYFYDQYNNPYFEQQADSVPDGDLHLKTRQQFFTSYVYQDSLKMYENIFDEVPGLGFSDVRTKKFEYNSKKQLCRIFYYSTRDTVDYFRLTEELFYDEKGNHIKTINYCDDNGMDINFNKIKIPCENDSDTYNYNSKNQLIEEFHLHRFFFQIDKIKYFYDSIGRLERVSIIMEQAKKYFTNRYYKY